jgi:HTH-type transcriptional regulator/antitoxin MqsA
MRCGNCERGTLHVSSGNESFQFRNAKLNVLDYEFSTCDHCSAEIVTADQFKRNVQRIADAKRAHLGLLSSNQIRSVRKRFDLSQADASKLFGGGPNVFAKYETGEVLQSESKDKLFRLVMDRPDLINDLRRLARLPTVPAMLWSTLDHVVVVERKFSLENAPTIADVSTTAFLQQVGHYERSVFEIQQSPRKEGAYRRTSRRPN